MIEPSRHYRYLPALTPGQAAEMVADAIARRQKRATTVTGRIAEATYATAPKVQDAIVNAGYKLFPDR